MVYMITSNTFTLRLPDDCDAWNIPATARGVIALQDS